MDASTVAPSRPALLGAAIALIARAAGPRLRPAATRLLYDLGTLLGAPRFSGLGLLEPRVAIAAGLRALRATGEPLGVAALDSVRIDPVTRVREPRVRDAIKRLAARLLREDPSPLAEPELWRALSAIDDTEALARLAELQLQLDASPPGSAELLRALGRAGLAEPLRRFGESFLAKAADGSLIREHAYREAARFFAAARDRDGIRRVVAAALGEPQLPGKSQLIGEIESLPLGYELARSARPSDLSATGHEDAELVDRLIANRRSTPADIRAASAEAAGAALAEGKLGEALTLFEDALDDEGLVRVGDALLAAGEPLLAWTAYFWASRLFPAEPT